MAKAPKGVDKKSKKRTPTGHEVMKRPPPMNLRLRPTRFEFDPKKAYSAEQLSEMGAISIKWNQIEAHIDFIGSHVLFAKSPFWLVLSVDRAIGTTRKIELLEECAAQSTFFNEKTKHCIADAFYHFKTYRSFRNAIIHHSIYDHEKGIGSFVDEQKKPHQIMVSLEALRNFYSRICVLHSELQQIDMLFRVEAEPHRFGNFNEAPGEFVPCKPQELRDRVVPEWTEKVVHLQKQRKSLPPLPKFPDADLIRSMGEDWTSRLDAEVADQER